MFIERDERTVKEIEKYLNENKIEYDKYNLSNGLFHLDIKNLEKKHIEELRALDKKLNPTIKLTVKHQAADKETLTPKKAMQRQLAPEGEPTEEHTIEL